MKRMVDGSAIPIASSSAALLSVIKNFGFHDGFQDFKICKPLAIMSVVSNWGAIEVFITKKKQGNAYLLVFHTCYDTSISV